MRIPDELVKLIDIASRSESNVLISGPTGSGKTCLARQIHDASERKGRPFVTVNLAALHEGTLESELFGHEKGAYTGAQQRRTGRFEMANGGTVFLDEVGELSLRLQARLLEFLQSRIISPVGSSREIRLDVRVVAATNRDLLQAIKHGEFREDLFYRLRVISLHLKPLAHRGGEFRELVQFCLEDVCKLIRRPTLMLSDEVAKRLEAHIWPGNFRELRNVLEYAVMSSDGSTVQGTDLPAWFKSLEGSQLVDLSLDPVLGVAELPLTLDFQGTLCRFEKDYIERALRRFRGRINQTARQIGMNKTTLLRRIRAYGIKPEAAF